MGGDGLMRDGGRRSLAQTFHDLLSVGEGAPRIVLSHQHRTGQASLEGFLEIAGEMGIRATTIEVDRTPKLAKRVPREEWEPCEVSILDFSLDDDSWVGARYQADPRFVF